MTFTTVNLTGERVLVKGTDIFGTEGQTVLDGSEWASIKREQEFHSATEVFDEAVEEFFRPIMEAGDKLQAALSVPRPDPDTYLVLDEGEEGTEGRERRVIKLNPASTVLRLIERGDTDRLVWVMDSLEVMTVEDAPATDTGVTDEGWSVPEQRESDNQVEPNEG